MQNYISFKNIIDVPENTFTTVQYDMTECATLSGNSEYFSFKTIIAILILGFSSQKLSQESAH